ncbi:MAG: tetratricopeptide repeat protein [Rubrivivax sp.]|nr:tetratricopeptide repeat protein [Rubrivivax sp.]
MTTDDATSPSRDAPTLLMYGPPRLVDTARGSWPLHAERRHQLLALLAWHGGERVPREHAAALLWPEHGNSDARRNLRHVVFRARELPGAQALQADDHTLCWPVATDLRAFVRALDAQQLDDAIRCRRGEFLSGLDDPRNDAWSDWLAERRRQLDERWQRAAGLRLAELTDPQARDALARHMLEVDPLDETALAARLQALLALGQPGAARGLYEHYRERLAEVHGIEPARHLRELRAACDDGARTVGPAAAAQPAMPDPSGASAALEPFVGRRVELTALDELLADPQVRLLTLLGPGGIGKSRLAREWLARRPSGLGAAWWVDLQDLHAAAAVLARIAQQVGVPPGAGEDPVEGIVARLSTAPALLVLDNAEHLRDVLALPLALLLARVPALRLFATSRIRLGLDGERVWPLAGLPVPDADSRDADAAPAFDAVRLFAARARRAQPDFAPEGHLAAVIDIVEAAGGMPLAIEIAASWIRLLPPTEIARGLRESIDLLEHEPHQGGELARPEHRSVRAVLERGWQLLAPDERAALAALAVFEGGFTRAAARAVGEVPLPLLSSLVDAGIVERDDAGRFRLHPLVAAFAAERLREDPARADQLAARHAAQYAALLAGLQPHARGHHRPLVEAVDAEFANALAAWRHALRTADAAQLLQMLPVWRAYFDVRGRFAEGIEQLGGLLDLPVHDAASASAVARGRGALATLMHRTGDLPRALAVADAGIALAERWSDRRALVSCLAAVGSSHSLAGRWNEAQPIFERALALARADGDRMEIAASATNLGICAKKAGRFDEALALYGEALAIDRELGHVEAVARRLNNIGNVHLERGRWTEALQVMQEGLVLCQRDGIESMQPYFEAAVGLALYELGDVATAEPHFHRALKGARAADNRIIEMTSTCFMARLASRRGDATGSLALLQQAARMASGMASVGDLLDVALYHGEWLRDRGRAAEAAALWRMAIAHPACEAGVRASAEAWLAALPAGAAAVPLAQTTLELAIERLLAGEPANA